MPSSTPGSVKYGKHYTAEEVADIFAPPQATVDAVHEWLISAGITAEKISQSVNKQWMQLDILAPDLESLLQAEYHVYEHAETSKATVACDQYHVPAHIQKHIDYITPGIKLFAEKRRPNPNIEKRTFGVTSGDGNFLEPILNKIGMTLSALLALPELAVCDIAITPVCIKTLYNVTAATKAAPGNQLGIFEDLGDVYSQADLNEFFLTFAGYVPAPNPCVIKPF